MVARSTSRLAITTLFISSLAAVGCSSDDSSSAPAVPTDAITISESNAKQLVEDAMLAGEAVEIAADGITTGVQAYTNATTGDVIRMLIEKIDNMSPTPSINYPTGIVVDEACTEGGTVTGDITETETSANGTLTFTSCIELGVTINGTISFSASIDAASNWSLTVNGNMTASDSDKTVSVNGLAFNETGNDLSGDYSINTYTYTAEIPNGGFLVQLQAPIVGNESVTCPASGIMLVTGADSTQVRATINSDSTVRIEVNDGSGTFTEITTPLPGSPYPCADFFS